SHLRAAPARLRNAREEQMKMHDAPYESARHADGREFWCSILADWRDAPLLLARRQLTEAFQPSGSDLAQRASTPCAARKYQRFSQPSAANQRNAQLSLAQRAE
ncbi:hypothetical protein A2U01_0069251, partial [Trifolium medium]|nr:hypothetical protein [Trifolium medium]